MVCGNQGIGKGTGDRRKRYNHPCEGSQDSLGSVIHFSGDRINRISITVRDSVKGESGESTGSG